MKNILLAGFLLAAVAPMPAFAQDTKAAPAMNMSDMAAGQYVEMAASSDMFEIESSKLAMTMGQSEPVKKFANHMVSDHGKTSADLMAAAKAESLEVPKTMMPKHADMVAQLKSADAASFDALYIQMQTMAHQEAVALHTAYSETGKDMALKEVATKAVPIVTEHLKDVKAMSGKA